MTSPSESASTLPAVLSQPSLLRLWDVLPEARVVGGAVRDYLAARPVADIDFATPRSPEGVAEALARAGIRVIPTGLAHGTVTAVVEGHAFEVTTLRRDVVTDGRHAVVAFTDDWQADAARRDFTFNAMSLDRAGVISDYFGGVADLGAGRVRFVGDARTRIAEDYLRVLRFYRFFGRFGREDPWPETGAALQDAGPNLWRLSPERVWGELRRILAIPDPRVAIGWMDRLGTLSRVVPGPLTGDRLDRLLALGAPVDPLLRMAALSNADAGAITASYRLSVMEKERLAAVRGGAPADDVDDVELRRWLIDVPRPYLIDRSWLHGRSARLRARIAALPDPVFPVQGRDLLARGMAPGREVGDRLATLRGHWRDGGGLASRDDLLALVPPEPA